MPSGFVSPAVIAKRRWKHVRGQWAQNANAHDAGKKTFVPVILRPLPATKPDLSQTDYLYQASVIVEVTTANCSVCRRLTDRDRFKECRKDGKRAVGVVHTLVWQMATEDPEFQNSATTEGFVRVAASQVDRLPGINTAKKPRSQYRLSMTTDKLHKTASCRHDHGWQSSARCSAGTERSASVARFRGRVSSLWMDF